VVSLSLLVSGLTVDTLSTYCDGVMAHQSVVSLSLLVSGLTVDTLSTYCDGVMAQCVKLMLSKFLHLWFLLFDYFVFQQNVSCLKRFTRYGHYTSEVEGIIIARHAVVWQKL